ncbi:MAG: BolA family transcriptional regulator [Polyangiaceae bacterium]|jgi:stress-induced morphogen|nr:BolA family transcriptional regulator [Polyangiaceae bacterium]
MIEPSELLRMLQSAFPGGDVQVEDLTGTRDHYRAVVVSEAFEGKGLIERHRAVYAALGDAMRSKIHALTLETKTPGERGRRLT